VDATFRPRTYHRNFGLGCVLGFLAWGALGMFGALTDPEIRHRLAAIAVMAGIPLLMAGMSAWVLVAYWRAELTIQGTRLVNRGIFRSSEISLLDVTEARWRTRSAGGSVVLRNESARLSVEFGYYEADESFGIVHHLRSVLRPDVQTGWNLFAYKTALLEPRSGRTKPGPDEVLLRRDRWDRYLVPSLVMVSLAGVAAWRIAGESLFLAAPLFPLVGWALIRATTPADGMVVKKLSSLANPDTARILGFLLVWFLVGVGGVIVHEVFRPRLTHADAVMIVGGAIWSVILLFEAGLQDRRQARSDREAADLAAKARGEAGADPWQTE
jgi:hypothetical protein